MALYDWTEDFSVGISTLDGHHRKLFDLMNKLHEAMKEGRSEEVMTGIIKELAAYTIYHFHEEEILMEKANYSGLQLHKAAHREFIAKIEEYKDKIDNGMVIFVVVKLASTVAEWLKQHIMGMDKKYSDAMLASGIG